MTNNGVASHLGIKLSEYDARIRTFIPDYGEMLNVVADAISPQARTIVDLGVGKTFTHLWKSSSRWMRRSGFVAEVLWRRGAFAVLMGKQR